MPRHGGYFGAKETPYAAVLSAQEKVIAGVIVHLQVTLFAMSLERTIIEIFGNANAFLQEGIRYNLHQIMEVEKTNISCLSMPQNK